MKNIDRMTLKMTLTRTGQFTQNGNTEFTFRGVSLQEGRDKTMTVYLHSSYVKSRLDIIELSLMPTGQPVEFDVGGRLSPSGLFEVDHFYGVRVK